MKTDVTPVQQVALLECRAMLLCVGLYLNCMKCDVFMLKLVIEWIVVDPYGPDTTVRHACDARINC